MGFAFLLDGNRHEVTILARKPHLVLSVDGRAYRIDDPGPAGNGRSPITIAGVRQEMARIADGTALTLRAAGQAHAITWLDGSEEAAGSASLSALRAPMPGAVIEVHAAPGQVVAAGDPILTIESMKLQTVLGAPRAGVVAEIARAEGELFGKDEILARLADEEPNDA